MRWLALLAVLLPALASSQWHLPLDVRNHRSVSLAFLRLTPRSHTARPGETILSYSLVGANEFRVSGSVDEDAETWRALFSYQRGLDDDSELFIEAPLIVRGGGWLDSLIEWWHGHVINQPDPVRNSTAQGRSVISFPGGEFEEAFGIGDVTVGLGSKVTPELLARVAVKLPTGDASKLLGSGALDIAFAADYRLQVMPRITLDLNGGLALQGGATHIDDSQSAAWFSALSLTFVQTSKDAWTVQWNSEQFPSRTGTATLDKDHRVLSFGYQRRLDEDTILQLYFSEDGDFLHFPGGPTLASDFTVGARLIRRQ